MKKILWYTGITAVLLICTFAFACAQKDVRPVYTVTFISDEGAVLREEKIKRGEDGMCIRLQPTHDIAAALGRCKHPRQRLVGFALETQNEKNNARDKLKRKNLDFIVLNSLRDPGAGFACDTNKITILSEDGEKAFPLKSKQDVAVDIVNHLCDILA